MAAELDQAGLVRVQRQRELPQPFAHRIPEAPGLGLVLEANDSVVGIPHDDHVARGLMPSPALGPEIEGIVQVDVREQRRDDALNAKDNFQFERKICGWKLGLSLVDMRRKR